jgi:hypothetical protein
LGATHACRAQEPKRGQGIDRLLALNDINHRRRISHHGGQVEQHSRGKWEGKTPAVLEYRERPYLFSGEPIPAKSSANLFPICIPVRPLGIRFTKPVNLGGIVSRTETLFLLTRWDGYGRVLMARE